MSDLDEDDAGHVVLRLGRQNLFAVFKEFLVTDADKGVNEIRRDVGHFVNVLVSDRVFIEHGVG